MTDKQIIIDDVDVSGCKYYLFREQQPNGERCCGMGLVDCNGNDCLYKKYKRKEQECEELREQLAEMILQSALLPKFFGLTADEITNMLNQLDQLKAEVKSKTEYIQEQRDIINQYNKEIEMYKKCQGKRASKREEELKVENDELKMKNRILETECNEMRDVCNEFEQYYEHLMERHNKLKQTLTEIKEIIHFNKTNRLSGGTCISIEQILQKISECEVE